MLFREKKEVEVLGILKLFILKIIYGSREIKYGIFEYIFFIFKVGLLFFL